MRKPGDAAVKRAMIAAALIQSHFVELSSTQLDEKAEAAPAVVRLKATVDMLMREVVVE